MRAQVVAHTLLGACLSFLLVGTVQGQRSENLLTYGIVGDERGAYSSAISKIPIQKLLLDIAAEPRSQDFVDSALEGTDVTRQQLEELELIRRQGTDYVISFTLFTSADVRKLRQASERYGRSLAQSLLSRQGEIEAALQQYQVDGVDPKEVAYILLGCFSLDWDGLDLTAEKGYRTTAKMTPNGQYVPWAEQKSEITLKGVYWGSHNNTFGEVTFTSFGDHFSVPRTGLPDILGVLRLTARRKSPKSVETKYRAVLRQSVLATWRNAGRLLLALREKPSSRDELAKVAHVSENEAQAWLDFLEELGYVSVRGESYSLRVPVVAASDRRLVREIERIGREVMERWLRDNFEQVNSELSDITPLKYGVPPEESFTQIWHYIFGITNRHLVEAGLFADPYAADREYKGFIPAVWHQSVYDRR